MASNPSACPSLRMVSASIPPWSTRSSAACRIRSRLRGTRGALFVAIDKAYAARLSYAISLQRTEERRHGGDSDRAGDDDEGDRPRPVRPARRPEPAGGREAA